MKLAMWTYEGPPHVGAMRVATGARDNDDLPVETNRHE